MSESALHFFPGVHRLIWVVDGRAKVSGEAWGGATPQKGMSYKVMKPRRTTPGRYIVYSYAPYMTPTWAFSKIRWGTPLKVDPSDGDLMFAAGRAHGRVQWKEVEKVIPGATTKYIQERYFALYHDSLTYDSDGDHIPEVWVFNDFGAMALRYFKDLNDNRRFDPDSENLSGEMFHTTPENEAEAALGEAVNFEPSHGCIHLHPKNRDALYKAGAFRKGGAVIIHRYNDAVPKGLRRVR